MRDKKERLLGLAKAVFPNLSEAEEKMLRAAAKGEDALCGGTAEDKGDNVPDAGSWGKERTVRAAVLRWLCTERQARDLVGPKGVQLAGARVEGQLDLEDLEIPFRLGFLFCALEAGVNLMEARASGILFGQCKTGPIRADRARIRGILWLIKGFTNGGVSLGGAKIANSFSCAGGNFENAKGDALNADGAEISGNVVFDQGFHARGAVRLRAAKIAGNLACRDGTFENVGGVALQADGAKIGGTMFPDQGFRAKGEVRLPGARIRGNLDCTGGTFENPGATALIADGMEVGGGVFLSEKFHATGGVRLLGARIRGDLSCTDGTFENPKGDALNADRFEVGGNVFLGHKFRAKGEVRLIGARIRGNLDCTRGTFENTCGRALNADRVEVGGGVFLRQGFHATGRVCLAYAEVRVLADDESSWPAHGDLDLRGFVYGSIAGPVDSEHRIEWLARQYPEKHRRGDYHPQPYEQLAAVLRRSGHVAESKKVLMAKEKDLRKYGDLGPLARAWNWILGATIGYGYRVRRTLYCAAAVIGFGILVFWLGHRAGLISPTFPPPAEAAAPCEKRLDQAFCPWIYSLDTFLPIVDLHQECRWLPNRGGGDVVTTFWPDRYLFTWGDLVCTWFWFEILAGWLLTTLALAGLTGLIRRD